MRRPEDTPTIVVQKLAEAFNRQDLEALGALYAANCVVAGFNGPTELVGFPALRAQHEILLEERPRPRLSVTGRMAQGDVVAQHETISRGLTVIDRRIAIYTMAHGKVARVDLVR